jgi:hypothetical protein
MFTFAISNTCNIPPVKTIAKQVKTKKWCKQYQSKLGKYQDKMTNSNRDERQIVGGMLHAAYGVNIGEQVLSYLKDSDLNKIRENLISLYN